jgi:hypothetical protein
MRYALLYICFTILIASCIKKAQFGESVLAKVGTSILLKSEAKANIPTLIFEKDSTSALLEYRQDWIKNQILLQEGYRLGIHNQNEVIDRLDDIRSDYITKTTKDYIIAKLGKDISVSDEEARLYYQENKNSFILQEPYLRFRHFRSTNYQDAQDARQDLLGGIAWEIVLENFSINPSNALKASKKFWPKSVAASDYEILNRYLQVIGINEISVIKKIGNEYHFVQLLEERAAGDHPDLDWLIDQIKDWLILEKKRIAFTSYVKTLYLQAQANNEIETFDVQH